MSVQASLGQFEQLVLTAILSLGDNAYGVTIRTAVGELAAPRNVSLGAVYATLDRLEEKKLITSWLSDPTPERGGRSKRHYRLEPAGERALHESVVTSRRVYEMVERIWGSDRRLKPARQH
jgi:DNA-binding PadR family transcriptional regulator